MPYIARTFLVPAAGAAAAASESAEAGGFTYAPEHKANAISFQDVSQNQATTVTLLPCQRVF